MSRTLTLMLALAVVTAGVLAAGSSGAARRTADDRPRAPGPEYWCAVLAGGRARRQRRRERARGSPRRHPGRRSRRDDQCGQVADRTARCGDHRQHRPGAGHGEGRPSGPRASSRGRDPDAVVRAAVARQRLGDRVDAGAVRAGARRRARLADGRKGPVRDRPVQAGGVDRPDVAEGDRSLRPAALPADDASRSRLRRHERGTPAMFREPDQGPPAPARADLRLPGRGLHPAASR